MMKQVADGPADEELTLAGDAKDQASEPQKHMERGLVIGPPHCTPRPQQRSGQPDARNCADDGRLRASGLRLVAK